MIKRLRCKSNSFIQPLFWNDPAAWQLRFVGLPRTQKTCLHTNIHMYIYILVYINIDLYMIIYVRVYIYVYMYIISFIAVRAFCIRKSERFNFTFQ